MDEYQAFAKLTASLEMAEEGARELARLRPDQPWQQVAASLNAALQLVYRLVGTGAVGGKQ